MTKKSKSKASSSSHKPTPPGHDDHIFNDMGKSLSGLPAPYGGPRTDKLRKKYDNIRNKPENRVRGTQGPNDPNSLSYGVASSNLRSRVIGASENKGQDPNRPRNIREAVHHATEASVDHTALRSQGRNPNTDSDVKAWKRLGRKTGKELAGRKHGSSQNPQR